MNNKITIIKEECELAVGKLLRALTTEYPDIKIVEQAPGKKAEGAAAVKALNWLEHTRIERGNPVRVYEGIEFMRTK